MRWLALLLLLGCEKERIEPPPPPPANDAIEFVKEPFETLYSKFLLHEIKAGPKAALWQKYYGRWVRWSGQVVSFTPNGMTFKQLANTVTFDVSLFVEASQKRGLKQ